MSRETYKEKSIDDGSPVNPIERMEYTGRVSGFFKDIFEKKIYSMLTEQHNELANPLNTRDTDLQIKGTINALSLLLDWGDECMSEYLSYMENPPADSNPEGED
jgi:hypothetical protein